MKKHEIWIKFTVHDFEVQLTMKPPRGEQGSSHDSNNLNAIMSLTAAGPAGIWEFQQIITKTNQQISWESPVILLDIYIPK